MKNFVSRKNRQINKSQKIRIYRNLNNGKISIKQGSLVVGYCDKITLKNCSFLVSEKGRQRVLKEKVKNVHAFIEGFLEENKLCEENLIKYDPYKFEFFMNKDEPIHRAKYVTVDHLGAMFHEN